MMTIILKSYGFGGVPRPSFRISHLNGSLPNLEGGGGLNIFRQILLDGTSTQNTDLHRKIPLGEKNIHKG